MLASGTPAGSLFDVFFPVGIALDNTNVYWGEGSGGGAVRRVPKVGGTVIDINRGRQAIGTLALDSDTAPTTIFYSPGHNAGFFSIPIAGGTPTTLATNVGTNIIKPFIVDSSHLFGVDTSNPGSLFSIPLSGGTPTYLANNLQTPGALATDGTFLYYSNDPNNPPSTGGPSAILKIAKTGGTHSGGLCITDPNNPSGSVYNTNMLAVDANNVYLVGFVNGGAGAGPIGILKAPKP